MKESKKERLRKMLKPLIKECLTEILLESGIERSVQQIAEGMATTASAHTPQRQSIINLSPEQQSSNVRERMNREFMSQFSAPASPFGGSMNTYRPRSEQQEMREMASPLGDIADHDAGLDLSLLFGGN